MESPHWLQSLFRTIDDMDPDGFIARLSEGARFRFGNTPEVTGRAKIREAVAGFFQTIRGLDHRLLAVWAHPDSVICQGEVTYIRKDGRRITLPFMNLFVMKGDRIDQYRIYADLSPLYSSDP